MFNERKWWCVGALVALSGCGGADRGSDEDWHLQTGDEKNDALGDSNLKVVGSLVGGELAHGYYDGNPEYWAYSFTAEKDETIAPSVYVGGAARFGVLDSDRKTFLAKAAHETSELRIDKLRFDRADTYYLIFKSDDYRFFDDVADPNNPTKPEEYTLRLNASYPPVQAGRVLRDPDLMLVGPLKYTVPGNVGVGASLGPSTPYTGYEIATVAGDKLKFSVTFEHSYESEHYGGALQILLLDETHKVIALVDEKGPANSRRYLVLDYEVPTTGKYILAVALIGSTRKTDCFVSVDAIRRSNSDLVSRRSDDDGEQSRQRGIEARRSAQDADANETFAHYRW